MFTGIVQGTRKITGVDDYDGGRRLMVQLDELSNHLERGASVSINGTCLTVVSIEKETAGFDIIQESLDKTNLGPLQVGDFVNIERACRYGDEMGGHHVTGHIDTVGTIKDIVSSPNNRELILSCDTHWLKFLIPKGWIAIDGISLTVVTVETSSFSVCLIPETIQQTTLGQKQSGDAINLEFDHTTKVIVQTLERLLPEYLSSQ